MQMSEFELTCCNHTWGDATTTNATCTNAGYESKTCSICRRQYRYNYVSKLGHSFTGEGVDEKCTRCDKTKSELSLVNYLDSNGSVVSIDPTQELTSANNSCTV